MTNELTPPLLLAPITSLQLSDEFKAMTKANDFETLDDLLSEPLHTLPYRKLSNYHMLRELLEFLETHNLHGDWED